jgi:site-specific DNA-methyltransferase (adenine-specific)
MDSLINQILCGSNLDILPQIPDNSVDCIISDPPYGLSFMGKKWDGSGIEYNIELWQQCLRVLKPGGHLIAFSSNRTYHRMATAIEDAGFTIRDMLDWVFGSSFAKGADIGKKLDKKHGNERKVVANPFYSAGRKDYVAGKSMGKKPAATETDTIGTSDWEGWKTQLKAAKEPICLAQKPIQCKTIADNVELYGTGALNIDSCRVKTDEMLGRDTSKTAMFGKLAYKGREYIGNTNGKGRYPANLILSPAGSEADFDKMFPSTKGSSKPRACNTKNAVTFKLPTVTTQNDSWSDTGSAQRYYKNIDLDPIYDPQYLPLYYCPKASQSERNAGVKLPKKQVKLTNFHDLTRLDGTYKHTPIHSNHHPTVKPLKLMEWLIELLTKKGQIVLDPFAGSGTTLLGCVRLDRRYIGIELSAEYCQIAQMRIDYALSEPKLFNTAIETDDDTEEEPDNNPLFS